MKTELLFQRFISIIYLNEKKTFGNSEKTAQTGKLESTFVYLAGEAVLIWGADVIIWGWKDELTTIVAVIKICLSATTYINKCKILQYYYSLNFVDHFEDCVVNLYFVHVSTSARSTAVEEAAVLQKTSFYKTF